MQRSAASFRDSSPWPLACTLATRKRTGERGMGKQVGYAVVGAGAVVERALLPAFARAGGDARLAAIVSTDRSRSQALAQEHRATAYHLDEFRQCLQRDDVHAVYIALPNSQRSEEHTSE